MRRKVREVPSREARGEPVKEWKRETVAWMPGRGWMREELEGNTVTVLTER